MFATTYECTVLETLDSTSHSPNTWPFERRRVWQRSSRPGRCRWRWNCTSSIGRTWWRWRRPAADHNRSLQGIWIHESLLLSWRSYSFANSYFVLVTDIILSKRNLLAIKRTITLKLSEGPLSSCRALNDERRLIINVVTHVTWQLHRSLVSRFCWIYFDVSRH